jgi:hypothetical protein
METVRELRPDVSHDNFRRSDRQFALYLAGMAFWAGSAGPALRWSFRSGLRLPIAVAPYLFQVWRKRSRRDPDPPIMARGAALDTGRLPAALVPYDRIYARLLR